MDYTIKYLKYKTKYANLKNMVKGTYTGIKRAYIFADNIINNTYWNNIFFSHGGFIRHVCIKLLGNNYEIIEDNDNFHYKFINKDNNLVIDIFSGIPKSNLARCFSSDEELVKKFDKKKNKKDIFYKYIGNGAIIRVYFQNKSLYLVRHFPSTANLSDVTNKGSKYISNPDIISGDCFNSFLNNYSINYNIFSSINPLFNQEINNILSKNIIYTSCLNRTIQTAKILIYQIFKSEYKIKYCILEGIHEIGRWDIANKCPNNTKFECFNL
jgi:hypothetical protein